MALEYVCYCMKQPDMLLLAHASKNLGVQSTAQINTLRIMLKLIPYKGLRILWLRATRKFC